MNTVKLTMAQALVRFLDMQYVCVDGKEEKFVHGIMGIFGHGNVVGLGQALEQYADQMPFIQGKNEQEIAHVCVAFAKQMRRRAIYACTASIGPGSLQYGYRSRHGLGQPYPGAAAAVRHLRRPPARPGAPAVRA